MLTQRLGGRSDLKYSAHDVRCRFRSSLRRMGCRRADRGARPSARRASGADLGAVRGPGASLVLRRACRRGGAASPAGSQRAASSPATAFSFIARTVPKLLLARFACAWLGATALLSNAHLAAPELARIIAALRPRAAITQPSLAERVAQAGGGLAWIALTETDTADASASITAAAGDRFSRAVREPRPRRAPDPTAPAMILFTTGSTAASEGGAVDARQSAVGRQGRRAAARVASRRHLSGAPAAVSCRRLYLVAGAGAVGWRHHSVAAEVFSEPLLAGGAGASGDRRVARGDRRISAPTAGAEHSLPAMAVCAGMTPSATIISASMDAPAGA